MISKSSIIEDVKHWVLEDAQYYDLSSLAIDNKRIKSWIISKQEGVISGVEILRVILNHFNMKIISSRKDGETVQPEDVIMEIEGEIRGILKLERTMLNLFAHMSGISTFTNLLMSKIRKVNQKAVVAGTRKTIPGLRKYQKLAIIIGGGDPHRMSLSDMVLLKENHIAQFLSIEEAITSTKRNLSFTKKIEVEARTKDEAVEAVRSGADIVLLDNFLPDELPDIISELREINSNILIEVSGNIGEPNIESYAELDVDVISVGKITHSVNAFDMSMIFENVSII